MDATVLDHATGQLQRTSTAATSVAIGATGLPHPHLRFAALAAAFGFDGASYFLFGADGSGLKPAAHWSTTRGDWLRDYRRYALHVADPRLLGTHDCRTPVVWHMERHAQCDAARRFARCGSRFGVGSGLAFSIRDGQIGRAVMCWDFAMAELSPERLGAIAGALDTLALVSGLLLESVWSHPHLHPQHGNDDRCLTARECECLALAANGMTSVDISMKLGISERTANFHFGNIIAKLNVLNRGEAIARAVTLGLYRPTPRVWASRS